jgi:hypothetical protein
MGRARMLDLKGEVTRRDKKRKVSNKIQQVVRFKKESTRTVREDADSRSEYLAYLKSVAGLAHRETKPSVLSHEVFAK